MSRKTMWEIRSRRNRGEPASAKIPRRSSLPPLLLCLASLLCAGGRASSDSLAKPSLDSIESELRAGCGCDSSRVSWSAGGGLSALVSGLQNLEAALEPAAATAARHTVHIEGLRDGRRVSFSLVAELECFGPHLRAARALAAGARVAPTDLEVVEGWHTPLALRAGDWSFQELHAPRGLSAHHELVPGDLVAPPLVRRAQVVTLVYRAAGLELRGRGLVRRDGWLGERVSVRLEGGTRDCDGVVSGPGEVTVASVTSPPQGG